MLAALAALEALLVEDDLVDWADLLHLVDAVVASRALVGRRRRENVAKSLGWSLRLENRRLRRRSHFCRRHSSAEPSAGASLPNAQSSNGLPVSQRAIKKRSNAIGNTAALRCTPQSFLPVVYLATPERALPCSLSHLSCAVLTGRQQSRRQQIAFAHR